MATCWTGLIFAVFLVFSQQASAQSIALNPDVVEQTLINTAAQHRIIMVNGPNVSSVGSDKTETQQSITSAAMTKLLLSLIAERMNADKLFDYDTPISSILPDLIEPNPFERAVTIRHLLQETSGLATPPQVLTKGARNQLVQPYRLKKFILKQRSANQLSVHDPVGWAILAHVLTATTKASMEQLLTQYFSVPMGLSPTDIKISYNRLSGGDMPIIATLNEAAATTLIRLLVRNAAKDGTPYLPRSAYNRWLNGADGFALHPSAVRAAAGMEKHTMHGRNAVTGLNPLCSDNSAFVAFPNEGAAFLIINPTSKRECTNHIARMIGNRVASQLFPPTSSKQTTSPPLKPPSVLSGRYISADTAPAWLRERLNQMLESWFTISGYTETGLILGTDTGETHIYRNTGPYEYEMADPFYDNQGSLLFSPFKLGGYVIKDGHRFRRVDILGLTATYEHLLPWMLLVLASAGIYRFTMQDRAWRNMGTFSAVGAVLIMIGLYCELTSWPYALYEQDRAWLINLWRTGLNIGLMAVLTAPLFTISFSRNDKIPHGLAEPLVKLHLILISLSALALLLILVVWGIAGTFSAY